MIVCARWLLPTAFRMTVSDCFQPRTLCCDLLLHMLNSNCFSAHSHSVLHTLQRPAHAGLPVLKTLHLNAFSQLLRSSFQPTRCYRVKKDSELTNEEEFICKVTKVAPYDKNTLEEYGQRLKYLVDKGCKPYELVEYPEILRLSEADINERLERLHSCGQSTVSIPLLKFAKPENTDAVLKNSLRRYLKQQNGLPNKVDEIRNALRCTDDEMLDILKRNLRLVGARKRKFIVEKVKCLLDCGAVIEDIKCNTNLLNNKTLEDIESRAKRLVELGYNDPLPIGVIGRDDEEFEVIIARLAKQRSLHPTSRYLESREIIAKIPEYASKKLHVVKPKVDFLLSRGYMGKDIIEFPSILELSLETIRDAVIYLQSYHLDTVSLEACHKYATKKRVTSRQNSARKVFAKVLQCHSTMLPPIPKDLSVLYNKEMTLRTNCNFLYSIGFTSEDVKQLPIVLAHSTAALKHHWDLIQSEEDLLPHFESWKEDKAKLLQLLQYSIEKKSNFSHAAITDEGYEEKRLEESEAESLDYESNESELETHEFVKNVTFDAAQNGPREELEPHDVLDSEVKVDRVTEFDPGMEVTEFDPGMEVIEFDPGMEVTEFDPGMEHDTGIELDSGDVLVAALERDLIMESNLDAEFYQVMALDPIVEVDLDTKFKPGMELHTSLEPDQDMKLDLGVEYDPGIQHEPCMEHDLDLEADPGMEPDQRVENERDMESVPGFNTSCNGESTVEMENIMAQFFPSSNAHWTTSHDR